MKNSITKFKTILVPFDFSEYSLKAVELALHFGERFGSKLTLMHVITLFQNDNAKVSQVQGMKELVKKQEKQIYQDMLEHLGSFNSRGVKIDTSIKRGFSPAESILESISEDMYDLVVMSTHGRTGLQHLLVGSTTEKVVRHSSIPVLTAHQFVENYDFKNILVPVDFSEYSKRAVDYAVPLANRYDADLIFLNVIEHELYPIANETNMDVILEVDPDIQTRSTGNLKEFVGIEEDYASYAITNGRAHRQIVDYSKEMDIDLILMATRGLSGLEHMLIGSTTERVVRNSACPVLTIPSPKSA